MKKSGFRIILLLFFFFVCVSSPVDAKEEVHIANSQDWVDVYSVMLRSSIDGERSLFLNSKSIEGISKLISEKDEFYIHASEDPFLPSFATQLSSQGYIVGLEQTSSEFNIDLDHFPDTYFVLSRDSPRLSLSLAPVAIQENAWVLIVDETNVDIVSDRLSGAEEVVAVGEFQRSILDSIEPHITERINNKILFEDSQELVDRFGVDNSVVLADGSFLEVEFFNGKTPVLLSGGNKIPEETFEFLERHSVESVVIVGNNLAVIGEQIRSKSKKNISVFVKFGQGGVSGTDSVYALTMFPLPEQTLSLDIGDVIYDKDRKELIVQFMNDGDAGLYEFSTISVLKDDMILASVSDIDPNYLGKEETISVPYSMDLPIDSLEGDVRVEFYTSYGALPSQLDAYLTNEDNFQPPYTTPLSVRTVGSEIGNISIEDVAYYRDFNRVGITLSNPNQRDVYVSVKINGLVVNGLEKNLYKESRIAGDDSKTVYLPVSLDRIDMKENDLFDVTILYGPDEDFKLKKIVREYPFEIIYRTPMIILVIVVMVILTFTCYHLYRRKINGSSYTRRMSARKRGHMSSISSSRSRKRLSASVSRKRSSPKSMDDTKRYSPKTASKRTSSKRSSKKTAVRKIRKKSTQPRTKRSKSTLRKKKGRKKTSTRKTTSK